MKISLNNRPYFVTQQNEGVKNAANQPNVQKAGGKFDEIHIHQTPSDMPDDKFISMLKDKIMAEVKRPTSAQQLETIKNQVNSGAYPLNLEEVAAKMLMI